MKPLNICRCGCGEEVLLNQNGVSLKWIPEHKAKLCEQRFCACGCGEPVRRNGLRWNKWKRGHSVRKHSDPANFDHKAAKDNEYILRKYGVTREQYDAMVVEQGGLCDICGTDNPGKSSRSKRAARWSIDHNHATGEVRGLLCRGCNAALGLFNDDSDLLDAAAEYLRFHKGEGC